MVSLKTAFFFVKFGKSNIIGQVTNRHVENYSFYIFSTAARLLFVLYITGYKTVCKLSPVFVPTCLWEEKKYLLDIYKNNWRVITD